MSRGYFQWAYALVKVFGKKGSKELKLLADAGSSFTWIRRHSLEGLGVEPLRKRTFKTLEGREASREVGEALIESLGERVTSIVIFGEAPDGEFLGAYSREGLGIEVDPVTGQLKKVDSFIAY